MSNIGDPKRVIISEPLADPVPREIPIEPEPERMPIPEREPDKVPA